MSGVAIALVLAAAVAHAAWNTLAKQASGGAVFVWLFSAASACIYLPFAIAVVALGDFRFGLAELLVCLVSAGLHLAYYLLLQRGYAVGDLSVVYPTARAAGPTLSVLAAVLIFGERPSPGVLLGGVLIVAGVVALVWERGSPSRDRARASVAFGLLVGAIIGCYTLWDAHAVSALLIPPLLLDYVATLGRLAMLSPYVARRRGRPAGSAGPDGIVSIASVWRDHRRAVLGVAILSPLSYILVLMALVSTPVSYVAPAREVSVLFAVLIGGQLLGEGSTGRRLLAAVVMFAGIVVLATG